jgi:DNA invertase Pin-like site-specific DNA recombinase
MKVRLAIVPKRAGSCRTKSTEPSSPKGDPVKRAALYVRVSTLDQHPETQAIELRQFAQQRGYEIVYEYVDHGVSGTKVRRPALDQLLKDASRHKFDAVLVWSCDRLARSTRHFLQVLDELNELGIQFHSQREAIDTDGPLGRAIVIIISAIAELEKSLIVERVRAGMRRAKLEGRRIGRTPLDVDHAALVRDRLSGMSLTVVAKKHGLSRASVVRFAREAKAKQLPSNPVLKIMTSEG